MNKHKDAENNVYNLILCAVVNIEQAFTADRRECLKKRKFK